MDDGLKLTTEIDVRANPDKVYAPEGFDTPEDFLKDMREVYAMDVSQDKHNRDEAYDDLLFAAGEQWDPKVLKERKGLPCLVINNIPQFTAQLVGDWRESRKAIKVVPSAEEDTDVASVRGDLIRSIEMQSRANRIYDTCFESTVQCGDGAFRVSVEYAQDDVFDQDLFIRPIDNCLAVVWDRFSTDPTGRDAKHCFVDDRLPKKEFNRKYPKAEGSTLQENLSKSAFTQLGVEGWIDNDSVRVTEYWRLVSRDCLLGLFEGGKVIELKKDNIDQLVAEMGPPVKTRVSPCTYAQMHLVSGFAILEGPFEYRLNRLPIIRMSGRVIQVGDKRVRHGLVRFMKDPIRLKNFWRSVDAEQLGYAPKAQWIAPFSAIEGREDDFRKAHLSRDPLLIYNDDATAPPQRVNPPVPQTALMQAAQVNAQDMKDVTGIHDASLGIRSNETSGRAIQARQREGDIAALTFYDNGNASVLEAGDVINQLIPQIYDGTRIIRVVGEDQTVKFQRVNDPMDPSVVDLSVGKFDVALTTGSSYTTRRVESAQAMMDAIQVWPQLMTVAGDLVAKAQDWPGADKLAERLKKTIPPNFLEEGEGPALPPELEQQAQQMQMEMQALQQENQALKDTKDLELAKLQIAVYNAETARIKALSDHDADMTRVEQDAIKMIIDGSKSLDLHELEKAKLGLQDEPELVHNPQEEIQEAPPVFAPAPVEADNIQQQ